MKKKQSIKVPGRYLNWVLRKRKGIWYADPRSGNPMHKCLTIKSLGTTDFEAAVKKVHHLDLVTAVKLGLASRSLLTSTGEALLSFDSGCDRYMTFARRPEIAGGVRPRTAGKYEAVFAKFIPFAETQGVRSWNGVTTEVVEGYAAWMDENEYAYSTEYFELNFIKQVIKWMIKRAYLPPSHQIDLRMRQPTDTTTYCYTEPEVDAMIEYCRSRPPLHWIGHAMILLSRTGMRVSELVAARWADLDAGRTVLNIIDESRQGTAADRRDGRSTKSRKSRQVPMHTQARETLLALQKQPYEGGRILHMHDGQPLNAEALRVALRRDVQVPLSNRFPSACDGKSFIDGRLHSFRHFFCSYCANNNVPERTAMKWLGHSNSRMIKRYYHLKDDESLRRMASLSFVSDVKNLGNATGTTVVPVLSL